MKKLGPDMAAELIWEREVEGKSMHLRRSLNENDFGGEETVGYRLKRKGAYFIGDVPADNMFGVYLGSKNDLYYVGVLNLYSKTDFNSTESYSSIAEVQQHWTLE
jgi:hypothetical protein